MAAVAWKSAISGSWTNAADWSTDTVPTSSDDVSIALAGLYTVSLTGPSTPPASALSLTISDPNATLAIDASGAGGATLSVVGAAGLSNAGTLTIGNAAITTGTTVSTTALNNSGVVQITGGTAAATLKLSAASSNTGDLFLAGKATLSSSAGFTNGGVFTIDAGANDPGGGSATLAALTNTGDVQIADGATLATGSLVNGGAGTIHLIGNGTTQTALQVTGVGTAAPATWTGFLILGGNDTLVQFQGGSIATIAANSEILLHGPQAFVADAGNTASNSALSGLSKNAGWFTLQDFAAIKTTTGLAFANSGTLTVEEGSAATIGGILNNTGSLVIDAAGPDNISRLTIVSAAGLTGSGDISLTGQSAQARLVINGAAPLTATGMWELTGDALMAFASGGVTAIAQGADLTLDGSRARVALTSNLAANGALAPLASNAGQFGLFDGAAVALNGNLSNTGDTFVDAPPYSSGGGPSSGGAGGSSLTVAGTLTNNGLFDIGNFAIAAATSVHAAALLNTSDISLAGGVASATLAITGNATNTSYLALDQSSGGGGVLTVGGTLTNSGFIGIGNAALVRASTVTAAQLANTGTLDLTGSASGLASLTVNSAAPAILNGDFALNGNAVLKYTGTTGITTINSGGSLSLDHAAAQVKNANTTVNSGLVTLANNFGEFGLLDGAAVGTTPATAFSNTGTLDVDSAGAFSSSGGGSGGSSLTVAGVTLTNTGTINIGNSQITAASHVALKALVNSGTLNLVGGTMPATLTINSAALPVLTGNVSLNGMAVLQYVGGAITTIATNAELSLVGPGALVQLSATPGSNSALTTLGANQGRLILANGETISTNAGVNFSNSDSVTIDTGTGNTGGSIFSVGGTLTNSDFFDVGNAANTAAVTVQAAALVNSSNFVFLSGAASSKLGITGNLTNGGSYYSAFEIDNFGGGGSVVTVGGTLTNSSSITIGNALLLRATTVSAAQLVNTGSLTLTGGTAQAKLSIAAAAPSVLSGGSLTLNGSAVLQYTGPTTITKIFSGTSLSLNGASAQVDNATAGANSALVALNSNAGTFDLSGGAALKTTIGSAGFLNTGTVGIDTFGPGGSSLGLVANGLINRGTVSIGNAALTGTSTLGAASLANTGTIDITGGATATAAALLSVNSAAAATWTGTYSLTGNAAVSFNSAAATITAIASGASLSLNGAQARIALAATPASNSDLTTLASNAGTLTLLNGAKLSTTKAFANSDTLDVDASGYYYGNGGSGGSSFTITGALTDNGTINIGNAAMTAAATLTAGALAVTNGYYSQVNLTGGTTAAAQAKLLTTSGAAPATLTGNFSLTGNALLKYAGSSGIGVIASGASLSLDGVSAVVNNATAGNNTALSGLTGDAGDFSMADGSVLATKVGFADTGSLEVDNSGSGGSSLTIGGSLALGNFASLAIGNTSIMSAAKLTASGFSVGGSSSTIVLSGGVAQASLVVNGAAPSTLVGRFTLNNNALLQFTSVPIIAIGPSSSLSLNGPGARVAFSATPASNSALTKLASNSGTFQLSNGALLTTTVGFTNYNATLDIDNAYGNIGGSSFTIGGVLTDGGSSTITIGNSNIVEAAAVTATGFVNSSGATLNITGGAALASLVAGGAAPSIWVGTANLTGNALLKYASGGITAIASGSHLNLDGSQAQINVGAATGNSALTNLASNAGTINWGDGVGVTAAANFTNTGTVAIDSGYANDGGSTLAVGRTLINQGTFTIGNANIVATTTVTAARLTNTTTITITGGAAQAALVIGAPAPSTLTGTFTLSGNALLDYKNAAITAIGGAGASGSLSLDGAQAQVDIGAGTNNSALATLAGVAGFFSLADGASLSTSAAAFNNTGSLYIDETGIGGSSLTIAGTLTNSSSASVEIGNSNLAVATNVTVNNLSNGGGIFITGGPAQAALIDNTAAPATLTGSFVLYGDALLQYASTPITAIGSFANLTLNGAQARVALAALPNTSSALTTLGSSGGTLDLENGASLTTTVAFNNNSALLELDSGYGDGGSILTLGGVLTNTGNVEVGNSGLSGPTTLTAAGLADNSGGFITVAGNTVGIAATLNLTASSSVAGSLSVEGGGILSLGASAHTLTVTGDVTFSGGTITGGTLAGNGGISTFSGTSTLAGVTIAAGTTVAINGGTLVVSGLTVSGAIDGAPGTALTFALPGADNMSGIANFPTINLADGGANTLSNLTSAAFANIASSSFMGVTGNFVTINDGNSGNTINEAGLTGSSAIIVHAGIGSDALTGGAGNDVFFAAGKSTMTGGAGTNIFDFAAPGANTITDFTAADEIVFSNAGFALGQTNATATPQALPAGLIGSLSNGTFTAPTAQFAYNASNGQLLFDSAGNTAGSTPELVATLGAAVHPALTATELFFVS